MAYINTLTIQPQESAENVAAAMAQAVSDALGWELKENNDVIKLYRVQTGAFATRGNADNYVKALKKSGFSTVIVVAK